MKKQLIFIALFLSAANALSWNLPPQTNDLNIFALPVGQGDCTIIQCPRGYGTSVTLVDCGSCKTTNYMSAQDVAATLKPYPIEMIFLSHPDKDHINYIDPIVIAQNQYPTVYHSCPWTSSTYGRYVTKPPHQQITNCCGNQCPQYQICNNAARITVLASGQANCASNVNGDSLVLKVEYSGKTVYLPGDFEGDSTFINNFLKCAGTLMKSDVYRLSHHGAYNGFANTHNVLDKIKPLYAFSSSGLKNNYVHPKCDVYDYLKTQSQFVKGTVAKHTYTCRGNKIWENRTITDGAFVTTYYTGTTINQAQNSVIQFSLNKNSVTPTTTVLSTFITKTAQYDGHELYNSTFKIGDGYNKIEEDNDCGTV